MAERNRLIPEIQRLQGELSGISASSVSSVDYHRRRAENVSRTQWLQQRAGVLRRWIAEQTTESNGIDKKVLTMASAYNLLVKIQEHDTGSPFSNEIEACLGMLERFVPIGLITEEAKAG